MPEFEVRRLQEADVETYRRIRLSTLATEPDYFGASFADEAALPAAHFADRLRSSAIFGACSAERAEGVVHFRRESRASEAHKGLLQGFFVESAWRQRGVGSALMTALLDLARHQVEQVTLTVVDSNQPAIALYRRFGFTVYGVELRARKLTSGYVNQVLMALYF